MAKINAENARAREANSVKREDIAEKKRASQKKEAQIDRQYGTDVGKSLLKILSPKERVKSGAQAVGSMTRLLGSANDPSWYNLNPEMVSNAANLSFQTPLTGGTQLNTDFGPAAEENKNNFYRGGIACLNWTITLPSSSQDDTGRASAFNVAMQNLYAWIRQSNSGARNYEYQDLAMYFIALDMCFTTYAWGRNIYRVANSVNEYDLAFFSNFEAVTGIGLSEYRNNLANFRYYLDTVNAKLSAFAVPKKLPIFNRHVWLASNLFKDTALKKSNLYIFRPHTYYGFGLDMSTAGCVRGLGTFADSTPTAFMRMMDLMLDNLLTQEDIGIISGDIRKAYGDDLWTLESVPVDDRIVPIYSQEVLAQINNATIVGHDYKDTYQNGFYQTASAGVYQGFDPVTAPLKQKFRVDDPPSNIKFTLGTTNAVIFNQYKDQPTPDDNMVSSRLTAIADDFPDHDTAATFVTYCGTEIINYVTVSYSLKFGGELTFELGRNNNITLQNIYSRDVLNQFDWFPSVTWNTATSSSVGHTWTSRYDLDNFAILSSQNLGNMHNTAAFSLYNVPTNGRK